MSYPCTALRINLAGNIIPALEAHKISALQAGEVLIDAHYSSINYKDALAITGASRIMKSYPTTAGIDVSGRILESLHPDFKPGDEVLVTGYGMGERFDGGFASLVKTDAAYVVKIPAKLNMRSTMILGTAGFTAALCALKMLQNQQDKTAPILITGATGGVGSVAIQLLSKLGFPCHAFSRKAQGAADYLAQLGAAEIVDATTQVFGDKPLEKALYGGAVDTVGGRILSWLSRVIMPAGNIASCGLAGGSQLETTVMPFILRGINLLGIDSVYANMPMRLAAWQLLAEHLSAADIENMLRGEIGMKDIIGKVNEFMDGNITGRYLVNLKQ